MKDFINERWRPILAHTGLTDFNALWDLEAEWFEEPNHRRGGWSGVARCELDLPEGGQRAILVTEELEGFLSMEERAQGWLEGGAPARPIRLRFLRAVAGLLAQMHANGIQHNCFFPKHVFTRQNPDGSVEARIIDLEKSRWRPAKTLSARRDLYSLTRQSLYWSRTDRLWFLKAYLGIGRLTPYANWLWRDVESRSLKKDRLHFPARHLAVPRDGTN